MDPLEMEAAAAEIGSSPAETGRAAHRHEDDDDHKDSRQAQPTKSSNALTKHSPSKPILSPTGTVLRYLFLSGMSLVAALLCPETRLVQTSNDNGSSAFDRARLVELVLTAVAVFVTFGLVFRSDPGYLTAEMMNELSDGASLDGEVLPNEDVEQPAEEVSSALSAPRLRHSAALSSRASVNCSEDDQHEEDQQELDPLTLSDPNSGTADASRHHNRARTRRPFCETCGFAPVLRSHHCRVCNAHVAMFDHHCDFIGTCIGERNHCRFWWFLAAQAAGFWCITQTIGSSPFGFSDFLLGNNNYHDNADVLNKALVVVCAKLFVYPLCWAAYIIWITHTFLALTNSTTFEWSKGARHLEYLRGTQMSDLPFSYSRVDQNLAFFCCQRDDFCRPTNSGPWKPTLFFPPGKIVRDSEDWWAHPWQNKYWSCC